MLCGSQERFGAGTRTAAKLPWRDSDKPNRNSKRRNRGKHCGRAEPKRRVRPQGSERKANVRASGDATKNSSARPTGNKKPNGGGRPNKNEKPSGDVGQPSKSVRPKENGSGHIVAQRHSDDWWIVLDVPSDASKDEIVRSYRQKIRQCHPDRVSGLAPEFIELAERHTKALNAASRGDPCAQVERFRGSRCIASKSQFGVCGPR